MWTWPSSTTGSASSPWCGSRSSACAARARAAPSSRAGADRPRRRRCRSTPAAASSRPAGCTASGCCTRRASSCAARVASARSAGPRGGRGGGRGRSHRRVHAAHPRRLVVRQPGRPTRASEVGAVGSPLADTNVRQLRSQRAPALRRADRGVSPRVAGLDGGEPAAVLGAAPSGSSPRRTSPSGPGSGNAKLFDNGWLVPGWPPEYGGRNATPVQQMVYFEELARLGVPRSCNPQGLSIITPSILDWGTEEQKAALRAAHAAGRDQLVPGHERAQRRQRPGRPADPGRAPRRPVRRERPEGVDLGGAPFRLLLLLRPDRPRGLQARRDQRAHHRHEDAGHHDPAHRRAHRQRARRFQRGLLHRRGGAGREPGGRAPPRLVGGRRITGARAGDAVDQRGHRDREDPRAGRDHRHHPAARRTAPRR